LPASPQAATFPNTTLVNRRDNMAIEAKRKKQVEETVIEDENARD
jgi:hypothetical protein